MPVDRDRPGAGNWLDEVIKRPVSVAIAALALVVVGAFSLWRLPMSLLPTLERPKLEVVLRDADRSREELLHELVEPLERRLRSLDGVLDVVSTIDDGEASVVLETEWSTGVDRLRIDAERRLADVSSAGLDELSVTVEAADARPILQIAVLCAGGDDDAPRRTAFAERILMPALGQVTGAGEMRLVGGAVRRAVIRPRAADLVARGLSISDLTQRLKTVGRVQPLGQLRDGATVRPLLLRYAIESLEDLAAVRISDTTDLRLGDVAEIVIEEIPDGGLVRVDGRPATLVEVYRAPEANAVVLAREGRRVVEELAYRAAPLELTLVRDRSREVVDSLAQLAQAAVLGLLLGTLVLRALLGSWRPTLTLMVVVPVSIVAAFGAFYLFDVSLDLVSLAGLALAAGMLVDNSIVVLEAIASAREQRPEADSDVVFEGTRQIAGALVASFLTTAVVFLPLVYLRGLAQAFFGVQAFAIVSTLLISLVASLSLTPVLARRFGVARRVGTADSRGRSPGRGLYLGLLDHALSRPWPWLLATAVLLLACVGIFTRLPRELVPAGASRAVSVDLRFPAGTPVREAARRLDALSAGAGAWRDSIQAGSSLLIYRGDGRPQRPTIASPEHPYVGELELQFAKAPALEAALEPLASAVASMPGLEASLNVQRGAVAAAVATAGRRPRVEVSAVTPERLERWLDIVTQYLDRAGWRALELRRRARLAAGDAGNGPAVVVDWDPVRLAALGVEPTSIARQVRDGLGGFTLGRADLPAVEPGIWLDAITPTDLALLPVRVERRTVPLGALGSLVPDHRRPPLERHNGRPVTWLDVEGGSAEAIEEHLSSLPLALGDQVRLAGETLELRRSFSQLRLALGLALVLVFLTVAALYESLRLPFVVLVTVPVAAAGAFSALALTGQSLNVMSLLGLILLVGIVVNNALVLLHRVEQHRRHVPVVPALRAAAGERYRPILMTTLTTLLGMIPLALLGGEGVELRRALAITVAGGLTTSWAASLLVVPLVYRALVSDRRS